MARKLRYCVAPLRQNDATLETTLRELQAVDVSISQFRRQKAAASYDESVALDHNLDIIGRDTRKC
jgi:hypothetical protein